MRRVQATALARGTATPPTPWPSSNLFSQLWFCSTMSRIRPLELFTRSSDCNISWKPHAAARRTGVCTVRSEPASSSIPSSRIRQGFVKSSSLLRNAFDCVHRLPSIPRNQQPELEACRRSESEFALSLKRGGDGSDVTVPWFVETLGNGVHEKRGEERNRPVVCSHHRLNHHPSFRMDSASSIHTASSSSRRPHENSGTSLSRRRHDSYPHSLYTPRPLSRRTPPFPPVSNSPVRCGSMLNRIGLGGTKCTLSKQVAPGVSSSRRSHPDAARALPGTLILTNRFMHLLRSLFTPIDALGEVTVPSPKLRRDAS